MNTPNTLPIPSSSPQRAVAAAIALGVTVMGLVGVDGLAKQRSVSPYAQVVQLERVVVTGQRLTAAAPTDIVVAGVACKASARTSAQSPC